MCVFFQMVGSEVNAVASNKKAVRRNFMWSEKKNIFLTSYLAECARNGEKKGKSFGKSVYNKAAKVVSDEFGEECSGDNVESWFKTTRKRYGYIAKLRERSGWAWDETMKMIKVDKVEAMNFIEENSYAKDLLNVPVPQYEEMMLVCGEDHATGCYGKSFDDIEEISESRESETPSVSNSSMKRSGREKRKHWGEEALSRIDGLTEQVSRLSESVANVDQEFCDRVFYEVMKLTEFEEHLLIKAFDYLTECPLAGKQFISKRPNMRKDWMEKFISEMD